MSTTKNNDYEYLETSEEARQKGLRRITRPKFVDSAVKKVLKESKNRITIYLDADIVEHFKKVAETSQTGYQTLINQALRELVEGAKPEKTDELIEKLLQDKVALRKLKAELKAV